MSFKIILIYFIIINLVGVIINISDKIRAKRDKWRIKESTLWIVALLGGAGGSYLTMKTIRHKTKHISFMVGFPILALLQIALIVYLYLRLNGGI